MTERLSRQTVGIAGIIGAVVLAVWAIGFLVFGVHGRGWHVLFPVALVLIIAQGVRRMSVRSNEPD